MRNINQYNLTGCVASDETMRFGGRRRYCRYSGRNDSELASLGKHSLGIKTMSDNSVTIRHDTVRYVMRYRQQVPPGWHEGTRLNRGEIQGELNENKVGALMSSGRLFSFSHKKVLTQLSDYVGTFAVALQSFGVSHRLVGLPAWVLLIGFSGPLEVLVQD